MQTSLDLVSSVFGLQFYCLCWNLMMSIRGVKIFQMFFPYFPFTSFFPNWCGTGKISQYFTWLSFPITPLVCIQGREVGERTVAPWNTSQNLLFISLFTPYQRFLCELVSLSLFDSFYDFIVIFLLFLFILLGGRGGKSMIHLYSSFIRPTLYQG